jgi:hypothetical protein
MTYHLLENLSPYLSENMRDGVSCKEALSGIDLMVKLELGLCAHMTSVLYYLVHKENVARVQLNLTTMMWEVSNCLRQQELSGPSWAFV